MCEDIGGEQVADRVAQVARRVVGPLKPWLTSTWADEDHLEPRLASGTHLPGRSVTSHAPPLARATSAPLLRGFGAPVAGSATPDRLVEGNHGICARADRGPHPGLPVDPAAGDRDRQPAARRG